jgi:hypothetical protein
MPETNWEAFRTYFKELLHDGQVRKAIDERTDISARTLARWVSGETEVPDRKRLASLLRAVPEPYREPLLRTITQALPDFAVPLLDGPNHLVEDLPGEFWARLVEINATTPKPLHFMTIVQLIFRQLQVSIDPERLGLHFFVVQCSPPPSPAHPVRSLRLIAQITSHESHLKHPGDLLFLGAESLAGYSVGTGTAQLVQNVHEEWHLPVLRLYEAQSVVAYPIQRTGAVAGCFVVGSPQPHFFSQWRHSLLQIGAYQLSLAFETDQFYTLERIHLHPMPPASMQRPYLTHFHERVLALLHRDPSLGRSQAERLVWQQIEEALLTQAPDQPGEMNGTQRRS